MGKWLWRGALGVVLAVLAGAIWLFGVLPRAKPPAEVRVAATPEVIERGRYLTINVLQCVDCHSVRDWTKYGGPPMPPIGAGRPCMDRKTPTAGVNVNQEYFPGVLCIRNITPDADTGIGTWSDGEIIRAVREGIGRDGRGLFPIMPYFIYRHLSDEDVQAVVAYLRTLPAADSGIKPERQIEFPLNLLVRLWPEPLEAPVVAPDRAKDRLAYGEYLARIARCEFCHTPREPTAMEGFEGRRFAGGMPFHLGKERVMYPMNLTPHPSGLGGWTREQFIARFRAHATPATVTPAQNTLMNWNAFAGMTDEDLDLLWDFFMTLPPVPYRQEPI
jgi:mono/diheme cytochrome c family protein